MDEREQDTNEIIELNNLVNNGQFDKNHLALAVAESIVKYNDLTFLNLVSDEVIALVKNIVKVYKELGEYKIYSNLGCSDHSEMAKQLSIILK